MLSFSSWFMGNKRQLQILTLASKTQHEDGRYVLSFDVFKNSDYDRIKEIRGKDSQVYKELKCIAAPCSGDIEMELKDKKCQFTFTVYGALEPSSMLEKGENVLEYNDAMSQSTRRLHLIPTFDVASGGRATIKFWVDGNVKHTVTICDVPVEKTKMSSSSLSKQSSDGSSLGSSQTFTKSVDEEDHADSVGTLENATVKTSGPMDVPPAESADCDDGDEGAVGSETAHDKILTSASLQCLASGLSPQESQKLLVTLHVECNVIEQMKKDHPGDIVSAMFHCFLYWKRENKEDTNKHLYDVLISQLVAIDRKDIKSIIVKALNANKVLEKNDFKRL